MAVAFARAFTCFGMKPKGFADRSSEKIHIGSITILDFFIPLGIGAEGKRKSRALCVCEEFCSRSLQWIMPRKWNRNGYAGKVHWSFNSEFLCSWKHCERGLTQLQSRKNIRGNMEQRKQWLLIKSKVSRLRTHAAAFDMLTPFPVCLMGKPQKWDCQPKKIRFQEQCLVCKKHFILLEFSMQIKYFFYTIHSGVIIRLKAALEMYICH
ncbi:hypothetical protein TNCT_510001 [Trichonephila clavata]|uniref:Uncharacterized protein n=1 Tax=Trichonephila clavata TaxID=2740835 RepID=A0A8X6HTH8_TRICU|nr:hypothetical protein TNCT_510001 [Trichonephila clavata]